jgi:hypothetical protein
VSSLFADNLSHGLRLPEIPRSRNAACLCILCPIGGPLVQTCLLDWSTAVAYLVSSVCTAGAPLDFMCCAAMAASTITSPRPKCCARQLPHQFGGVLPGYQARLLCVEPTVYLLRTVLRHVHDVRGAARHSNGRSVFLCQDGLLSGGMHSSARAPGRQEGECHSGKVGSLCLSGQAVPMTGSLGYSAACLAGLASASGMHIRCPGETRTVSWG